MVIFGKSLIDSNLLQMIDVLRDLTARSFGLSLEDLNMKDDGVHENFFTVPELPHKKKEREAILLLQKLINIHDRVEDYDWLDVDNLLYKDNKDLVDWVMKYKGE